MSDTETKRFAVESLVQQCQLYILMHVEDFPVSFLSLLPLSVREVLLWRLPIADAVSYTHLTLPTIYSV